MSPLQGTIHGPRRAAIVGLLLLSGLVFLVGAPHLYGEKGNGRYLLPVLRTLDSELFAQDPMVDGMERFRSLFYDAAGTGLAFAGIAPEQLETVWAWGYWLSRLMLVVGLWWLATSLGQGIGPGVWLLAWAAHTRATFIGGTALFVPMLGHDAVAFLLCLSALTMILRGRVGLAWGLAALALLVHPLLTGHFLLVMMPPWLWSERARGRLGKHLMGWGAVIASALYYLIRWAPPSMDPVAASIFLDAESASPHVSLFAQPSFGWLKMILTVALAWHASRRLLTAGGRRCLLVSAMLWGMVIAVLLSAVATATNSVVLTQLQPLRAFIWVQFLAALIIAWATAEAWRREHPVTLALVGWLVFSMLGSLWSLGFAAIALLGLAAYSAQSPEPLSDPVRHRGWPQALQLTLLIAIIGVWFLGEHQPFLSLRDPVVLLPAMPLLAWWLWPQKRSILVAALLLATLSVTSWRVHTSAPHDDPAWMATSTWIRRHLPKDAVFLTPPGTPDFRFAAWRTSCSETLSALTWVAPELFASGLETTRRVAKARHDGSWSVDQLRAIGASCGAGYALVDGPYRPAIEPLFARRNYSVLQLPRQPKRTAPSTTAEER